MSLLEKTPTQYLQIAIKNPSKQRGIYVKYGYKIFNPSLVDDEDNPPLIMLMGLSGTMYDWGNHLLSSLSTNRCVIAVDHRGIGESHLFYNLKTKLSSHYKPTKNTKRVIPLFSLNDFAEDVFILIKYLNIKRISLCGVSMGGMIAQCFAILYPQIIDNLILLATAPCDPSSNNVPFKNIDDNKHIIDGFKARQKIKNKIDLRKYLKETFIIDTGGDLHNLDMNKIDELIDYAMNIKRPFKVIMAQYGAIKKWNDGIKNLEKVSYFSNKYGFNIVIIHGDKDLLINVKNGEFMSDKLLNSKFYSCKGEGHLMHLTKRGHIKCTKIINDLLNKSHRFSKL